MTSDQIHSGAAEQAKRHYAQRLINLGGWAERHSLSLKLAQSALVDAHFQWMDDENSSSDADAIFCEIGDAIELIVEVVAELRGLGYSETATTPNQLIIPRRCGHADSLELPPIGGSSSAGEPD